LGINWFVTEYNPQNGMCSGLVLGLNRELQEFTLDGMMSFHDALGNGVQLDRSWKPRTLAACRALLSSQATSPAFSAFSVGGCD
jgi:hypothetical protein